MQTMNCFKSCCQRSCCRLKAKSFPKLYDSFADSSRCMSPICSEMITKPYYQQPMEEEDCPAQFQSTFQSSAPNADSTRRNRSADGGSHSSIHRSHPSLNISLHHDVQRCSLAVGLLTISGLSVKNGQGIFLITTLLPLKEQIRSEVIPGTVQFAINQTLELPYERVHNQTLDISVFSATDADLLGKVSVVLEQLGNAGNSLTVHTLDLSPRDKAQVSLCCIIQ